MPLTGTCPECGAKAPLSAFAQGPEAGRAFEAAVSRLPAPVAARSVAYLKLHAPPGRAMNWGKALRLIEDLAALVDAPRITWDRQPRPNDVKTWAEAMDEAARCTERGELSLPLDGHGWLRKVAWTKAGQHGSAPPSGSGYVADGARPAGTRNASHRTYQSDAPETPAEIASRLAAQKRLGSGPSAPAGGATDRTKDHGDTP